MVIDQVGGGDYLPLLVFLLLVGLFLLLKPAVSLCSQPTGAVPLSVTAALQLTHSQEDSSRCSDNSSYEEPLSPISASSSTSRRRQGQRDLELPDMHVRDLVGMGHHFLPSEPTKWNVEDVYEFIRSLPGKTLGIPCQTGRAPSTRARGRAHSATTRK